MKLIVCLFVFCSLLFGCKNNELPSEHISNISVVREVSSNSNATQINKNSAAVSPSLPSKARFHIIVASHSAKEKAKAQALVTKLKAMSYPASMLYSSQRYRVSIECFTSEAEAKIARDEYRKAVDREDIWVHKVE